MNLALFFTRNISLGEWDRLGMLEREIKPYIKLAEKFDKIFFFTYGGEADRAYSRSLPANIKIVPKSKYLPALIYSFALPFLHKSCLKSCAILKTNQMDGSWAAAITRKLYGSKLVVRCGYEWLAYLEATRSNITKRWFAYAIERFAYMNADRIIITSPEDKDFIMKKFGIARESIEVIPNYIDTDKFTPMNVPKENRVIFVGRLEPVKNLASLIDAMAGLEASLVLVGQGSLKEELKDRGESKGVRIEFKGTVPQARLPEELNKSRIFILPSLSEGNPKALLEAMACGLPCIGTDAKGINSIIKDRENGLLCQADSGSIRAALAELLADRVFAKKIGDNARKTIEGGFSFGSIIEKEVKLYDQILRQGK